MKAIILAAGRGSRLSKYTSEIPKGLLKFGKYSLIEYQINMFKKLGINDISIVTGYMHKKFKYNEVSYFHNEDYLKTNMVHSLFCASEKLSNQCIVCYSDIIYEEKVLQKLISSECDIGVTVDCDFKDYWKFRLGNDYKSDMESMVIKTGQILSLGKSDPKPDEIDGRYVGLIKFSNKGVEKLNFFYNLFKKRNQKSRFGNRTFENWFMTDLLEKMIGEGVNITPVQISKGWLEFDTDDDYEKYLELLSQKKIERYINL